MAHLSLYTNENKVDIVFIQEPYCYNGEPCYIPSHYSVFFVSSHTNPRASLLIRQEIAQNFMLLRNFPNPDNVFVVTSTNPTIHIASSYLPHDTLEQHLIPTETVKPTNFIGAWMQTASTVYGIAPPPTLGAEYWLTSCHYMDCSQQTKRMALPTPGRQVRAGLISQLQ